MIEEIRASAFVKGPTNNVAALRAILDAIAADATIAPTHSGRDERTRDPFDAAALSRFTFGPNVLLWRRKRPEHWCVVDACALPIARVACYVEKIRQADIAAACGALGELMDRLQPAYAAMHLAWSNPTKQHLASVSAVCPLVIDYLECGPPGVFAWTWFGPALAAQIGEGPIVSAGGRRLPWGGYRLALAERPWELPFKELHAKQMQVDETLRAHGYFGDHGSDEKGPKWEPPP